MSLKATYESNTCPLPKIDHPHFFKTVRTFKIRIKKLEHLVIGKRGITAAFRISRYWNLYKRAHEAPKILHIQTRTNPSEYRDDYRKQIHKDPFELTLESF